MASKNLAERCDAVVQKAARWIQTEYSPIVTEYISESEALRALEEAIKTATGTAPDSNKTDKILDETNKRVSSSINHLISAEKELCSTIAAAYLKSADLMHHFEVVSFEAMRNQGYTEQDLDFLSKNVQVLPMSTTAMITRLFLEEARDLGIDDLRAMNLLGQTCRHFLDVHAEIEQKSRGGIEPQIKSWPENKRKPDIILGAIAHEEMYQHPAFNTCNEHG